MSNRLPWCPKVARRVRRGIRRAVFRRARSGWARRLANKLRREASKMKIGVSRGRYNNNNKKYKKNKNKYDNKNKNKKKKRKEGKRKELEMK